MSGHCDFCGIWHSASCYHPGRVLYQYAIQRAEQAEAELAAVRRELARLAPPAVIATVSTDGAIALNEGIRELTRQRDRALAQVKALAASRSEPTPKV